MNDTAGVTAVQGEGLSAQQRAMLGFAEQWWKYQGAKESAILERFGISATVYYQRLDALIDDPVALAEAPGLVLRLRRLREARREHRSRRRLTA